MDRLEKIKKLLREELEARIQGTYKPSRRVIVSEDETDFLVMESGWENDLFRHRTVFHFQIINDKIHLLVNKTDVDICGNLTNRGVLKSEIVIAFVNELERTAEGYAAA